MKSTTRKTANIAPIGSVWTGRDADGDRIRVTVQGDPIPGNELRAVQVEQLDLKRVATYVGRNWFKRAVRVF